MSKTFSLVAVLGLLMYSMVGLLPMKYLPHSHVLLGGATLAQLLAHEAQEAEAEQPQADAEVSTSLPLGGGIAQGAGIIVSLPQTAKIIDLVQQLDIALVAIAIVVFLFTVRVTLLIQPSLLISLRLGVTDPPPRFCSRLSD